MQKYNLNLQIILIKDYINVKFRTLVQKPKSQHPTQLYNPKKRTSNEAACNI